MIKAAWSCNTPIYTFDDFCSKHVRENNKLNRYNSNVDGESQVRFLLDGINPTFCSSTIPTMKVFIGQQQNTKERKNIIQGLITHQSTGHRI
jgi:hypothetical protein